MNQAFNLVATPSDASGLEPVRLDIEACAKAMASVAAQCDALCLKVGGQLCEAMPKLNDLSSRFLVLSETLDGADMASACQRLKTVASDVAALGRGLLSESNALESLITTNLALSRLITNVAEDVRFLVAMITSVKVESASIQDETEGLLGFAGDLARLATNAQTTIDQYHSTHDSLLGQLRAALKIQAAFETARHADLTSVALRIDESLATVTLRQRAIMQASGTIGIMTQQIGKRIGESVVALQVGDNTRQRIEHVGEALQIAIQQPERCSEDLNVATWSGMSDQTLQTAIAQICRLQALQLQATASEFQTEIEIIGSLLTQLAESTTGLRATTTDLFASRDGSASFVGDLEPRLHTAGGLIEEYKRSRATIDGIAESVIATFDKLSHFGESVADMVIDMTIIGTNAIVKSYRLGQRGAGLSIIAQHLRSHSLRIADGIKILTPALYGALEEAKAFASSSESQGVARVTELGDRMSLGLASFKTAGDALGSAIEQLDRDSDSVGLILTGALSELQRTSGMETPILSTVDALGLVADHIDPDRSGDPAVDTLIDSLMMSRYTMESERCVHDVFLFGKRRVAEPASEDAALEDLLF